MVCIGALIARDTIERLFLERTLSTSLGGDVTIAQLQHLGDQTELDGVVIAMPGSSATFAADRVRYTVVGDTWTVAPTGVRGHVTLDALAGDEAVRLQTAAHMLNIRRLAVTFANAGLVIARNASSPAHLEFAGITGTLDSASESDLAYDLHADVVSDTGAYPITARAVAADGGGTEHTWTAAHLPVAPFAALLGSRDVALTAGEARDVKFATVGGFRGTFTLADVAGTIAGHEVHALAGPMTIVHDGIGSTGLDATLADGTPVAFVGEVHDGNDWLRTLGDGTRDLRALGKMFALIASQANLRWMNVETTAPGITFGQYAMTAKTTPHVVQLITVDPHEPTVRFDTALAGDHVISTGARTSDLGLRTHAVAGANGDYFDIGRTYEPQGMLIKSGALIHGPTDHEAVVIDKNNKPTFAVFHLHGTVDDGTRRYPITLFNSWPTRHVAIITPDYGKMLPAAPGVTFVALAALGGARYRVLSLRPMLTAMPVVLGLGISDETHLPLPRRGDTLEIHYAIDPPVEGAVAGIGSGPLLLKDGQWYEDHHAPAPDERDVQWPVIAIGTLPDGNLMFAAVDGRHPERSIGMTRPEFAELLKGYGVVDAMALDSGGSVTLVSRAPGNAAITVRNVPSDFSEERYVSDALYVYSSAPLGTIVTAPRPHVEPTPGVVPTPGVAITPRPVPSPSP